MRTIELDKLEKILRDQMLAAISEPVLITQHDRPLLVVRSLLDDEAADELISQHPGFLDSIRLAREQKAKGLVRSLAEVRRQYATDES